MSSSASPLDLGQILIDFEIHGKYPEEDAISAARVEPSTFPGALEALQNAKAALKAEICEISREHENEIDTWIANAQSIQDDIERARQLSSQIVRQAEADEKRLEILEDSTAYVAFLEKELDFNEHLRDTLRELQSLSAQLDQAEQLAAENRILESLETLYKVSEEIQSVSANTTIRALKLLEDRCSTLKSRVHQQFDTVWRSLVIVDIDRHTVAIHQSIPAELNPTVPLSLKEATNVLKSYNELEQAVKKLWEDIDKVILKARTELPAEQFPKTEIEANCLRRGEMSSDTSLKMLFNELEAVIHFLIDNLTPELSSSLSKVMMPVLSARIKDHWLDTAIPSSLDDIERYQRSLNQVSEFAMSLDSLEWPGSHIFHSWVENAPKIWLNHKRETVLDSTRNQLASGIGSPQPAERIEKKMVANNEGLPINTASNKVNDEWDAAWDSDQEEAPNNNSEGASTAKNAVGHRNPGSETKSSMSSAAHVDDDDDDDTGDAWGWGDDDAADETVTEEIAAESEELEAPIRHDTELHQVTLSEKILLSSTPQPILQAVKEVLDDGATLTQPENETWPISPAAPGMFSLPTLILAEYRALSPIYYAENSSGNMYLFNDAVWLSEQLKDLVEEWKQRDDLPARASSMIRLDSEVKNLKSFGNRAYTNELVSQRTIINDLLAGAQNFFQQEKSEINDGIRFVLTHIRERHSAWLKLLPWSACASSIGSLVNTVASKLISDIFDLPNIGVDDAEHIATIISKVESLDDLFKRPSSTSQNGRSENDELSLAAQFVENWLKLSFLNQVLQSNLVDIKYLWNESELSYYFTVDEVVELISLSFENNHGVRQAIRDIRGNPAPRGVEE